MKLNRPLCISDMCASAAPALNDRMLLPPRIFLAALIASRICQAGAITNAIPDAARPLPLSAVRLTGGPLKHAQDLDAEYLLKLEPDRMMAGYRLRAGLKPKAEGYGGWDSPNG